jgi:hypothetical protein
MAVNFPAHKASMHISHNDHLSVYETVEVWLSDRQDHPEEWRSPEDRAKCIATNEIWDLQWYPDTPVGFCKRYASTFEGLFEGWPE